MSRKFPAWLIPLFALLAVGMFAWAVFSRQPQARVQASLVGAPTRAVTGSFERVAGPRPFIFPQDHGPHPNFQTEWWYYTGNLETSSGRQFGYQLTFFRRAIQPAADRAQRSSGWAAEQVYLAHFTLSDVAGQKFYAFEQFERGALGLAGAQGDPTYQVWLRDWSVRQTAENTYQMHAAQDGLALDLTLTDRKGPVLQGDQGYSQKGPEPGNASLYYSQTRLESQGTIVLNGQDYPVSGLSWMDREISTSALSEGDTGWDWFSLQLDDGSELMAYVLRRADGTISQFSSGTYIRPDGSTVPLNRDDFQVTATSTWKSPHSGGLYPAGWQVRVPTLGLDLQVKPLLADQELRLSFTYWEGAVRVTGSQAGKTLTGFGYVELTGYAKSLGGQV